MKYYTTHNRCDTCPEFRTVRKGFLCIKNIEFSVILDVDPEIVNQAFICFMQYGHDKPKLINRFHLTFQSTGRIVMFDRTNYIWPYYLNEILTIYLYSIKTHVDTYMQDERFKLVYTAVIDPHTEERDVLNVETTLEPTTRKLKAHLYLQTLKVDFYSKRSELPRPTIYPRRTHSVDVLRTRNGFQPLSL